MARWLPLLLLLALPAVLLLPGGDGFAYPNAAARFSDIAISHYPYGLQLQRALSTGRLPLWSTSILSGAPFAANPLTGLWYPPGWPALLFPLPLGFNLMALLHVAWGGLGLFLLLRREGLGPGAALLGGAAFALLPKLYAHYGAGHLTLVYAVAWTPWLLLASKNKFTSPLILALIFTADPRWSIYAGAVWLAYALAGEPLREWGKAIGAVGGRALLAGLLAAPLALPLLEFARLSTRAQMTAQDHLAFSLPPARLLGLLYPDFGGFHEFTVYAGLAVFALAALGFLGISRLPATRFWRAVALFSLVWSLGAALPFAGVLFSLPGLDLLRVPSRALFLVGLAACALAAHSAETLAAPLGEIAVGALRRTRLALAALAMLSLILTAGVTLASGALAPNFAWGSAFLLAAVVWVGLRLGGQIPSNLWIGGLLLLACADLLGMDRTLFAMRPAAQVFAEGGDVAEYLGAHFADPPPRIYSPSYSLPQQTAARWNIGLADGVDPLQLQSYSRYMGEATGVPNNGYSVTLPPFATGDPTTDNESYVPDAAALGRLNVSWVVSAFPLDAPGLHLEKRFNAAYLYRNEQTRSHAWVLPGAIVDPGESGDVVILAYSPERIELKAGGPGMLILAEPAYPGWQVMVDGQPRPLLTAHNLLRAVDLPPGAHTVVFTFRPLSVYVALALSVSTLMVLFVIWLQQKKQENHRVTQRPEI